MEKIKQCPICYAHGIRIIITNEMDVATGDVISLKVHYKCSNCQMTIGGDADPNDLFPDEEDQQIRMDKTIGYMSSIIRNSWNNPRCLEIRKKVLLP